MYEDIFELITIAAQKRNLKESTSHRYCQALTPFLKASNKPWQELTIEDADNYLTSKRLAGIMPETYNHYYGAIRFMYKRVLKINWNEDDLPRMKRDRSLPTVLSREEVNAILDDRTLDILTEYWFKCGKPRSILFPSQTTGEYLDISAVNQVLKRSAQRAGITKHVTSHAFTHSFASHLLEAGCDIKYIQALLGHLDPKSTEVYLHVSNKTLLGIKSPFDVQEDS